MLIVAGYRTGAVDRRERHSLIAHYTIGAGKLGFMFQRQRYEYHPRCEGVEKATMNALAGSGTDGAVVLVASPIDMQVLLLSPSPLTAD